MGVAMDYPQAGVKDDDDCDSASPIQRRIAYGAFALLGITFWVGVYKLVAYAWPW